MAAVPVRRRTTKGSVTAGSSQPSTRRPKVHHDYDQDEMTNMKVVAVIVEEYKMFIKSPRSELRRIPNDKRGLLAGYKFIKDHGPCSRSSQKLLEWTNIEIKRALSPLLQWSCHTVVGCLTSRSLTLDDPTINGGTVQEGDD
eukprot:4069703-Heterocapsa_arctica.AAC.1